MMQGRNVRIMSKIVVLDGTQKSISAGASFQTGAYSAPADQRPTCDCF